jgi:hypothetical protein
MGKTAVVFTCAHAKPEVSNERFSLLGKLLYDVKPDYVVDLGDGADMCSLNSFDTRKPEMIVSQSYEGDIDVYNDAQERLRHEFTKSKKRKPTFYGFEGNHENRIRKAVELDPRLHGERYGVSFDHLQTSKWFDEYYDYEYGAPALREIDGVLYGHFVGAGNFGRPLSGKHHGASLIAKTLQSTTVGHSHRRSMFFEDRGRAIGLVAGNFKGAKEGWAGQSNDEWWTGVVIKHNIEDGMYEPEFVSLERMKEEYQ